MVRKNTHGYQFAFFVPRLIVQDCLRMFFYSSILWQKGARQKVQAETHTLVFMYLCIWNYFPNLNCTTNIHTVKIIVKSSRRITSPSRPKWNLRLVRLPSKLNFICMYIKEIIKRVNKLEFSNIRIFKDKPGLTKIPVIANHICLIYIEIGLIWKPEPES